MTTSGLSPACTCRTARTRIASSVAGVKAVWGGDTAASLEAALREAHAHDGISVVHVPVYAGTAPEGGLGAYGSWNVGNWVDSVEGRYLDQAI